MSYPPGPPPPPGYPPGYPPPYGSVPPQPPAHPYPGAPYAPPGTAPYGAPAPGAYGPPKATALDAVLPTNPLAAIACWLGVFSLLVCHFGLLLGPIAVVLGVLSLRTGSTPLQESSYGKAASTARSWIGIVTGGIGALIGLIAIVMLFVKR